MSTGTKTQKMSTHRFIDQLRPGEMLEDEVYLVSQKDLRTTTNGSLYIHMVLADRTGQILTRIWNATQPQYETLSEGSFIRVRGRIESYKGHLQCIVDGLRAADRRQLDLGDFLPCTKRDVAQMWDRLLAILRTVENAHLRLLIKEFVQDETIVSGYKKAPAAVQLHHAIIGGLLEHTVNVLELAVRILGEDDADQSLYPEVSRDLVLASVFLHDIGKVTELTYETNFAYTTSGQLIGHITQAALWIDRKAADVEHATGERFPNELQDVLTHIVLAHHGRYEFGSPRLPACPEAFLAHYLDNIDAKLNMCFEGMNAPKSAEQDWTEYIRPLETRVFRKDVMGIREKDSP